MRGNVASVRRLVKAGVSLDGADRLSDALWLAAKNGHDGVVTALALAGADLNKPCTTGGSTPLLHAVHFGCKRGERAHSPWASGLEVKAPIMNPRLLGMSVHFAVAKPSLRDALSETSTESRIEASHD